MLGGWEIKAVPTSPNWVMLLSTYGGVIVFKEKETAGRQTHGSRGVKRGSKEPAVSTNSRCQGGTNTVFRDWSLCVPMFFSLETASVLVSFPVNGECFVLVDY